MRRTAARRRLVLHKTRTRDPGAWDFGKFWLETLDGRVVAEQLSLDEVEVQLGHGALKALDGPS